MILHSSLDVVEIIASRLLGIDGPIAVMAGHFALVPHQETGELIAGVAADICHETTRQWVAEHHYMGLFPLETWRVGIEVVQRLRATGREAKLLVLVNDWQHVPPAKFGERHVARDVFFANTPLPPTFDRMLREVNLDETVLIADERDGKTCLFWSESVLRARYRRRLRSVLNIASECAQEWVPLLVRLETLGYGALVSFVPSTCMTPVIGGTERAYEHFEFSLATLSIFPSGDAENFWVNTWVEL